MEKLMPQHRPLTDRDMALISVLCRDREVRCEERAGAAAKAGNMDLEKAALTDKERYQSLRLKMFLPS
jgi:hypothetical protein